MSSNRSGFSSNIGFIFATAGSAVGLGNIWKFPAKVGAGGGGAFIIIYFIIVFTLGASLMLTELVLGRGTQKSTYAAFTSISPRWRIVGLLGILSTFIILSYYCVVGGWVMKYAQLYLTGAAPHDAKSFFASFVSHPVQPIFYMFLFMLLTVIIVLRGVSNGIERANIILMPALLVFLIILLIRVLSLDGAERGLKFLFSFNLSAITPTVLLSALGQVLFSLSIGMSTLCTYASYLSKRENLVSNTGIICLMDTLIATLSAFIIIPAVFAANIPLGEGGSFAFTALPAVFDRMSGGTFFGAIFFLLLAFAAITSSISMLEALVAFLNESCNISRRRAAFFSAVVICVLGTIYSLSKGAVNIRGIWYNVYSGFTYPMLGDMLERLCDYIFIPLGGLGFCLFVGWVWGAKNAISEIEQDGAFRFRLGRAWSVIVRYIAPIVIITIMTLGMIGEIKL